MQIFVFRNTHLRLFKHKLFVFGQPLYIPLFSTFWQLVPTVLREISLKLFIFSRQNMMKRPFWIRGWFEPWLRTSWQGAKEPELDILKYEMILSFQSIWLILGKYDHLWFWVTGIWAPTFLVKVVTHKLYFSGVTAFSSLSADLESRLKPPSAGHRSLVRLLTIFKIWNLR